MRHLTVGERQRYRQNGGKEDWSYLGTSSSRGWDAGMMAGSTCKVIWDCQSTISLEEVKVVPDAIVI